MIEFFLQEIVLKIMKFTKSCNRRKKEASPHNGGEYMAENLIYQATIETDNLSKIYIYARSRTFPPFPFKLINLKF